MHTITKILTTAILILALLSAGCTDTGGGSTNDQIIPTETGTPVHTPEPTQEPTPEAEPTAEKINHPFDINDPNIAYIPIYSSENQFGIDINEGYKFTNDINGNYNYFDSDKNLIFQHAEYPNFDLYSELQPEQARALEEKYGYPVKLTREDADLNPKGDGQLDIVRIKYEGTKGSFIYESNIPKKGTTRLIEDFLNSK